MLSPTARTRLGRSRDRARTDRTDLYAVLDAALICHLGVIVDGSPMVVPTGYGRIGDTLYLHGSTGARSLRHADQVCVTVTLLDGIVLARSAFHHSMNYRSAMVYGTARRVDEPAEHLRALEAITEHLAPGQWEYTRRPTARELAATTVLAVDLQEASVKAREGAPVDDDEDYALPIWAGVLPVRQTWGAPVPDPRLTGPADVPTHIRERADRLAT